MKIDNDVLNVLEAVEINDNKLVLVGQLDRSLYIKVDKVLTAIGGKWNRKEKAHIFNKPIEDILDEIVLTGEYSDTKKDFGQFDTPIELAREIVDTVVCVKDNHKILEPSAGVGNLIQACLEAGNPTIQAYEIDADRCKTLHEKFSHTNMVDIDTADFMDIEPREIFDRVVMNPPFAKQADIDHVLHAFKFLKPGGKLVSIMSASVSFRENKKTQEFRDFIDDNLGYIEEIPSGSFKSSGTNVNTVLVTLEKA